MKAKSRGLKVVLRNDFLWFASILMLMCSVLALSFFYFNVNGRLDEERAWLESYSQSFLKDLQLGDVASVEAKIKRFTQRHGFRRVEVTFGKNVINAEGVSLRMSGLFEKPFSYVYSKLSDASVVRVDLRDPVGTFFGTMKITYNPHDFYRSGVSSALVIAVTFVSLFFVILGLYVRRLSDLEDPFLSLTGAIRKMKDATEGPTESIESRLESATVRTGIAEMDSLQREFSTSLSSIVRLQRELNDAKVAAAIARTTQALAHDVRRPFSMFKSIIQSVEAAEDPVAARSIMRASLPEVNQAMASVEGMIEDVMQIGSHTSPVKEEVSPQALVGMALSEFFRVYPEADVNFSYSFAHDRLVFADSLRVIRVLSNIVGNAIQAMDQKGHVWFRTRPCGEFVEFVIGNSGSFISREDRHRLFDAFFTSGKRDGTGLGLAIAKKIVEAHGGGIRCISEKNLEFPDGVVEFIFTLPAGSLEGEVAAVDLPDSFRGMQANAVLMTEANINFERADPREAELESEILSRLSAFQSIPTILLVDDEPVYLNGLVSYIRQSDLLSAAINVVTAKSDVYALSLASQCKPVLVIEDVDLGPSSENGIEVVRKLRAADFGGQICIHSNRFLFDDNRVAMEAGANSVLPKPMSRVHLLTLILAALPENASASAVVANPQPRFAYIDDSQLFLMGMRMKVKGNAVCHEFSTSSQFFHRVENDSSFLDELDFVLTDFYLSPSDGNNGLTFARGLRAKGYRGPIILASDAEVSTAELAQSGIDGAIAKSKLDWAELNRELSSFHSRRQGLQS